MRSMYDWIAWSNSSKSGTVWFDCYSDIATDTISGEYFEALWCYHRLLKIRRESEVPSNDVARLLRRIRAEERVT
jgi:hypothetical protein